MDSAGSAIRDPNHQQDDYHRQLPFAVTPPHSFPGFCSPPNAAEIQAPPGIPECRDDARKFCFAVLFDLKRRARMQAYRTQFFSRALTAIKR